MSVRSGSGCAPTPYAHVVQAPTWTDGVLGGMVLFVGMLTAQVLHGTGALVLDFGRLLSDRAQVVLDVLVVLVHRGGEVVRAGLDLWVLALNWVQKNGVLVMLIGLVISMSYM